MISAEIPPPSAPSLRTISEEEEEDDVESNYPQEAESQNCMAAFAQEE